MSPAGQTQPMIQGLSDLIKQILYSQISNNNLKSVNLKYITVGRLDDDMIVPPFDGAMFILID